jgi:hypothetical protein
MLKPTHLIPIIITIAFSSTICWIAGYEKGATTTRSELDEHFAAVDSLQRTYADDIESLRELSYKYQYSDTAFDAEKYLDETCPD